jgi:nicotinamide riboside kinase
MIRICLHGAESTGKSVLAGRLGYPWVPEYGRAYCEERGMDLTMSDLRAAPPVLVLDTDPLMTAAWAQMLFGEIPDVLLSYAKADLYLHFAPDVPWVADGTRFFGTPQERARFAGLAEHMLVRTGVPFTRISGTWEERER